jgi:hypothetical protein
VTATAARRPGGNGRCQLARAWRRRLESNQPLGLFWHPRMLPTLLLRHARHSPCSMRPPVGRGTALKGLLPRVLPEREQCGRAPRRLRGFSGRRM